MITRKSNFTDQSIVPVCILTVLSHSFNPVSDFKSFASRCDFDRRSSSYAGTATVLQNAAEIVLRAKKTNGKR